MKANAQIFLSYAREDEKRIKDLYKRLSGVGFKPWMDVKDILPGEKWKSSIQKAIQRSDFFLACLSANSVNKRGFLQKEIKKALDIWEEMLDSDIYLVPVRLEDCEVPERLREFQWVDLFEKNGWTRLVKAIQVGIERRAEVSADDEPPLLQIRQHPRKARNRYKLPYKTGIEELDQMRERQRRNHEETANLFSVPVPQLYEALAMLDPRHRKVLELRYGLGTDGEKRTYEEAAQMFGLSARRIQELEEEGLVQLRGTLF